MSVLMGTESCVSDLVDFEKMYLADVNSAAELTSDVYGVPMLVDHVGEFQYRARYYNQKPGTGIRFIPQKTDFVPLCFGVDEKTGLLTRKASDAKPSVRNAQLAPVCQLLHPEGH